MLLIKQQIISISFILRWYNHPSIIDCFDLGAEALSASIAAVTKYGGATAGYRTLLDALIPALSVLQEVSFQQYLSIDINQ